MIIGILGLIDSGKGTMGNILVKECKFVADSFAKPVKDAVAVIYGWDRAMLEGDTKESRLWREQPDPFWSKIYGRDFTPREAMQLMGTEAGRDNLHPDIWIHSLVHRNINTPKLVVTDVRFLNEISAIHNLGGSLFRVKRGDEPEWWITGMRASAGDEDAIYTMKHRYKIHRSEWDWISSPNYDTIINDGSIEDLREHVLSIFD